MNFLSMGDEISLADLLDIGLMTLLIYSVLVWIKRTKRAAAILGGIVMVAVVYLFAKQFNLHLTAAVLQGFFAVFLIALVVIFQEELRYFFEQLAHWGLKRPLAKRSSNPTAPATVTILATTLADLARDRIGALVVIQGHDLLVRHLEGGQELNGQLSPPILASIFDPHSEGHDGAAVIRGAQIAQFGCRLPLSKDTRRLEGRGTRHAAALGLAELTDALCIVVSEEQGTISVARHGELRTVAGLEELQTVLTAFEEEINPQQKAHPLAAFIRQNSREKVMALGIAVVLWFVLVHESQIVYRHFTVTVPTPALPPDLALRQVEPQRVVVTLSGLRKDFFLSQPRDVQLRLPGREWAPGRLVIPVTQTELDWPENLNLERVEPEQITLQIENKVVSPHE